MPPTRGFPALTLTLTLITSTTSVPICWHCVLFTGPMMSPYIFGIFISRSDLIPATTDVIR